MLFNFSYQIFHFQRSFSKVVSINHVLSWPKLVIQVNCLLLFIGYFVLAHVEFTKKLIINNKYVYCWELLSWSLTSSYFINLWNWICAKSPLILTKARSWISANIHTTFFLFSLLSIRYIPVFSLFRLYPPVIYGMSEATKVFVCKNHILEGCNGIHSYGYTYFI